jgi:hypothetical protein
MRFILWKALYAAVDSGFITPRSSVRVRLPLPIKSTTCEIRAPELGSSNPMPLSYRCIGSNLAEFRITATLQQRDEYLGPKRLQVDGFSCCQIGSFGTASSMVLRNKKLGQSHGVKH